MKDIFYVFLGAIIGMVFVINIDLNHINGSLQDINNSIIAQTERIEV